MGVTLVTGATGFAGQHICRELRARGHSVIGTTARDAAQSLDGVDIRALDIRDAAAVRALVREARPDRVLHLAGIASPANGDTLAFFEVNTLATQTLLEACRSEAGGLDKIVITSSANVYGEPGLEILHEDLCPAPVNAYGCSKLSMEYLAANFRADLPLQIVRPFNFTGRGQTARFLVPKIVSHFRARKPVLELGNIDVSRDFSDVRDVAREFVDLLEADAARETVNICSGTFLQLSDILSLCETLTGFKPEVVVNPAFVRANEITRLRGSRDRLDAMIGPRPDRPFVETLQWMLQPD